MKRNPFEGGKTTNLKYNLHLQFFFLKSKCKYTKYVVAVLVIFYHPEYNKIKRNEREENKSKCARTRLDVKQLYGMIDERV